MSRLTRSKNGYLRSLQVSNHDLFVFVEGKSCDPIFYEAICEIALKNHNISYCTCRASELPNNTGGKQRLLAFFKELRTRGLLVDEFKGKKTAVIFFVDKDVDDLLGITLRSPHMCYTKYYNVENYVFKFGDIARGGALASSLEQRTLNRGIGDQETWRKKIASNWVEWMAMCLYASKKRIRCECGFGKHSSINVPPHGSVDPARRIQFLAMLESKSGKSTDKFRSSYKRILQKVHQICDSGNHDYIFNGKWYAHLLAEEIRRIAGTTDYDVNSLSSKLKSTVLSTLDFNGDWASHLIDYVENIVKIF